MNNDQRKEVERAAMTRAASQAFRYVEVDERGQHVVCRNSQHLETVLAHVHSSSAKVEYRETFERVGYVRVYLGDCY